MQELFHLFGTNTSTRKPTNTLSPTNTSTNTPTLSEVKGVSIESSNTRSQTYTDNTEEDAKEIDLTTSDWTIGL